ncbi:MAG: flavodoxin family protein [Methanoregula sp.]|jgi:multimeric flavodoxin WrbA|uniref:flavodoxin family protein n=1 Tax=Methanoregula sp. TaxID=2052170 RepID=UPI003C792CC3
MKILAIHGSPRTIRSSTRKLAGFVLEGAAAAGAETEMIDLADCRIIPCTACDACTLNGICVNDDDVPALLARMKDADAIVFGSPVYIDNVTGQIKVFFDRLADAIHYQQFAGKVGCAVVTTAESGGDETVAYLTHVLNYLGVVSVGGISVATGEKAGAVDAAEPAARALGKKLVGAIRDGYADPVQEAILVDNRAYFRSIVEENRDLRTDEYDRWVKMGWIR